MSMRWSLPVLAISGGALLALAPAASAQTATYLAVGDSLAYGFDTLTTTPRSLGDRGYVAPYADWLQSITGQRPRIVNLGVPAESTETFFTGGSLGYLFNSNYSLFNPPTQAALLETRITGELNAGRTIETVSVHIGVNDFLEMTEQDGFEALPLEQQQAEIDAAMPQVAARYADILTRIRSHLPGADLIVLGYYNPFAATPADPLHDIAPYGATALNAMIQSQAVAFGARYVDLYTPFLGNESQWTLIVSDGDIHPNAAGYNAIAQLMIPSCLCEFTGDQPAAVDVLDLLAYLDHWFTLAAPADLDGSGGIDVFDLLAYLDCWFAASGGASCW